jgi:hypothetical protein
MNPWVAGAWDRASFRRILDIGSPLGVQRFIEVGSFVVFSALVARVGSEGLAAHVLVLRIIGLSFLPAQGFAQASEVLTGQAVGAGNPGGARRSFVLAVQLAMTVSATWAVLFVAIPAMLLAPFDLEPSVHETAVRLLAISAAFQIFDAMAEVAEGTLAGAGATRWVLATGFVESWLVRLPLSAFLAVGLGLGVEGCGAGSRSGSPCAAWWAPPACGGAPVRSRFRPARGGGRLRSVAPSPSGYGNRMDHRTPDHFDEVLRQVEDALDHLSLGDGPTKDALLSGVRAALEELGPDALGVELEAKISDLDSAPSVRVVDGGRDPEGPPALARSPICGWPIRARPMHRSVISARKFPTRSGSIPSRPACGSSASRAGRKG